MTDFFDWANLIGLEVPMHDLFFVGRRKAGADLATKADYVGGRQPAALHPLAQGLTLQVLHDDVGHAIRQLAVVRDLDEARVIDPVDRARFIKEPRVGGELAVFLP